MFLQGKLNEGQHEKFARVTGYIVDLLNNKQFTKKHEFGDFTTEQIDTTQSGCPNVIAGLTASPFWDTSQFPWIKDLEGSFSDIRRELLALKDKQQAHNNSNEQTSTNFQHYRSPNSSGNNAIDDNNQPTSDHLGSIATSKGIIRFVTLLWTYWFISVYNRRLERVLSVSARSGLLRQSGRLSAHRPGRQIGAQTLPSRYVFGTFWDYLFCVLRVMYVDVAGLGTRYSRQGAFRTHK